LPELPEVETVARELAPHLEGQLLERIHLFDPKFSGNLTGKLRKLRIHRVFRLGKQVAIEFEGEKQLFFLCHLRMSGRLIWMPEYKVGAFRKLSSDALIDGRFIKRHVRALLEFGTGAVLFVDPRRFGTFALASATEEVLKGAVDPLSSAFTPKKLEALISKSKTPIKPWLLRQDKVVGLGNIYTSEILFAARVHPLREAASLQEDELKRIHGETKRVLKRAIKNCGTTFSNFLGVNGQVGGYQKYLRVYDKAAQPCPSCSTSLERIVQQQRSTYFCPSCQQ